MMNIFLLLDQAQSIHIADLPLPFLLYLKAGDSDRYLLIRIALGESEHILVERQVFRLKSLSL